MFNNKDFIYRKRAAYSQEGCNHAINFFEKHSDCHEAGGTGDFNKVNHKNKHCTELFLKRRNYSLFDDVLFSSLSEYIKEYDFLKERVKPFTLNPILKIQRYRPNEGYFAEHCENTGAENIQRILAWMIYLNDVTDGGYTNFPQQKRKFQPRRGDVMIWPAYFTHTHHGVTSKTQTKYIATGWFCFRSILVDTISYDVDPTPKSYGTSSFSLLTSPKGGTLIDKKD